MRSIKLLFTLLLLVSCSKNRELEFKKPSEFLKQLYIFKKNNDYKEIEKMIYNIKYNNKKNKIRFNSKDEIIKGIKTDKFVGNFAYSDLAIIYHIQNIDNMIKKGDMELVKKYLIDTEMIVNDRYLMDLAKKRPESFLFYENEFALIILLNIKEGNYKLIATKDITDFDPKKIDWSRVNF